MMGFSSQQYRKDRQERPWKIHPAWRGIGCILFLLIPIMSWVIATLLLQSNLKIPLPYQMMQVVAIPFTHIREIDKVILSINQYFDATGFVFGQLFLTIIFSIIGYGIMAFLYAVLFGIAGPPRYGPFDVPPSRIKK
jgi:hypothetical protein